MNTIVEVKQGQLKGTTKKSILTGKEYFGFLGIPYAKPPVGNLRFQPPQPAEKWNGVRDAQKEGSVCIQKIDSGSIIGSEDCLFLNVYTPEKPTKNTSKAVMIFIHGGSFVFGSGSSAQYSPDYLINNDVILVTLNYRLHALGFLDVGAKNCAGNCGLRDQCLAIKWVKENIKQFGGDSENITIFGESSGAMAIYFHLLSPMSKGLFNKAIIESDIGKTFYENGRDLLKTALRLGQKLGHEEKDPTKLIEFLKKQSAEEICKQAFTIIEEWTLDRNNLKDLFGPNPEIIKENGFLPDSYQNLKKKAVPVPLIVGFNNKEGRVAFSRPNLIDVLKKDFTTVIINPAKYNSNRLKDMADKIKKQYLGDKPVSIESVEKIADLHTDYYMRDFYTSLDFMYASNAAVYIYEFSFFGKFNVYEKLLVRDIPASKSGACHADELPYLFYGPLLLQQPVQFAEPELTVIKNICCLWTNFAKSTNPTAANLPGIKWRPFKREKPCFLSIDKDFKLFEEKLRGKEFDFWNKLLA